MDIKILVATHKKAQMPQDSMYLPVQVGKALSSEDFGYATDDTGDNISAKNPYLCELTALYWGWKNLDNEYIGLAHYRRHFSCRFGRWKYNLIMTKPEMERCLSKADVVLPVKRYYFIETLYSHYKHTHDVGHLEIARETIERICPEYVGSFDKVMDRRSGHMFNMMVMRRPILNVYCEWLFNILFAMEKDVDFKALSPFDARWPGRIAELLLDVWITHNKVKYVETGMVMLGKENFWAKLKGFLAAKYFGVKYDKSK